MSPRGAPKITNQAMPHMMKKDRCIQPVIHDKMDSIGGGEHLRIIYWGKLIKRQNYRFESENKGQIVDEEEVYR